MADSLYLITQLPSLFLPKMEGDNVKQHVKKKFVFIENLKVINMNKKKKNVKLNLGFGRFDYCSLGSISLSLFDNTIPIVFFWVFHLKDLSILLLPFLI